MKQIFIVTFVSIFLLTITPNGMADKQSRVKPRVKPTDTKEGLQLSVELDKESYGLGDTARMKIRLRNLSQTPITIYKNLAWGASSSFTLSISAISGKLAERTFLDDAMHHPPFPREDFTTIQPGEFVEQERQLDLRGDGIRTLGVYQIKIRYHSPVPHQFAPEGLKIWAMENGELRSKPVTLKVTK
jgi:hypothetical protein